MKKIKISITGTPLAVDYCNTDRDFTDNYYSILGWETVDELHVNDGKENLIKKKGKYAKTKKYFHELFSTDQEHPLPVEVHVRSLHTETLNYWVEIPDDQEFDIKKLQLIKSDYEVEGFPYFIPADCIIYDEKPFETKDYEDLGINGKGYDEFVIEEFL